MRPLLPLLAAAALPVSSASAADPCPRTASLHPGRAPALYTTTAPFEHFGSDRTAVFPFSCTLAELTGVARPAIAMRSSAVDFSTPYNAATRNRNQLYLYGYGADAAREGGYVASVDPQTLEQRWRKQIRDPSPEGQWSYPGVMLAHGNGFLYAVYGNVLAKLDAATGRIVRRRALPEDPNGTGAAYNGMVVLPDGRIAAKRIERGPCALPDPSTPASGGAIAGLTCSVESRLPTTISVVEPGKLRVLSTVTTPEPVTGRITATRRRGKVFVYAAGRSDLFRYRYADGRLARDRGWGLVRYRTGAQQPGTGPGILGRFVVVQTNFLPSEEPLTVTAVDQDDSSRVFRVQPFADAGGSSVIVSKPALDRANGLVITHDFGAGQMAALRFDPRTGFSQAWRRELHSLAFSALVGGAANREIVIPDVKDGGDTVVWLSEATGEELARSAPIATSPAPGNIVTPFFGGRFFIASAAGTLVELRPRS